jgi:putative transposase
MLLAVARSTLYTQPSGMWDGDEALMRKIDALYTKHPFYGSRRITQHLRHFDGIAINRKRVQRLMRIMGIEGIAPNHGTSTPHLDRQTYPYLLRNLAITKPNQVWGTDITYVPLARGHCDLVAFLDWYSRYVVSWEISPSLDTTFCIVALERAFAHAIPSVHNSDQGCQYTSHEFLAVLKGHPEIRISMDGRGRCMDNIFTERLWRSVKYEDVYLKQYQTIDEVRTGLTEYFRFYNHERLHQALGYQTPASVYDGTPPPNPRMRAVSSPIIIAHHPAEPSLVYPQ